MATYINDWQGMLVAPVSWGDTSETITGFKRHGAVDIPGSYNIGGNSTFIFLTAIVGNSDIITFQVRVCGMALITSSNYQQYPLVASYHVASPNTAGQLASGVLLPASLPPTMPPGDPRLMSLRLIALTPSTATLYRHCCIWLAMKKEQTLGGAIGTATIAN